MQSESSRLFKSVTQLDIFYPAVALFVDVSNLDDLQAELEYRNPSLKKNPISKSYLHQTQFQYRPRKNIFWSKLVRDDALQKGRAFVFDTSHRIVEVDLNREVRRCFKCQRYGHTQHNCTVKFYACGKCAGRHCTKDCPENQDAWKCVSFSGEHQSGHSDCE